jgi:hypothetical protein
MWADDPGFWAKDHIQMHHLTNDSSLDAAAALAAELMIRPLLRRRPLWEFHVIAGIDEGRFAVLFKMHHGALAVVTLDLQQVRRIRAQYGGTVNAVLISVVTGALRQWIAACGGQVKGSTLRALIPASKRRGRRSVSGEWRGLFESSYSDRVPTFDAAAVDCRVSVFVEGMLTSFGHDATLRVTSLSLDVGDDDGITADFDSDSLRVVDNISDANRRDIERNADKTLEPRKYPKIQFRSVSVERDSERAHIKGDLTLHGVTNQISLDAHSDGQRWHAKIILDQRKYGIKPFSAMLGALKIKPEVEVNISIPNP